MKYLPVPEDEPLSSRDKFTLRLAQEYATIHEGTFHPIIPLEEIVEEPSSSEKSKDTPAWCILI
jgi:hypothetical protein